LKINYNQPINYKTSNYIFLSLFSESSSDILH